MTQALIATDLHLATDVLIDLTAQVTLHLDAAVDEGTDLVDLFVGQVADSRALIDAGGFTDRGGGGVAN